MKKMLSLWKVNKTELFMLPAFVLGIFLTGFAMAVLLIALGEEVTSFPMGTLFGSIGLVVAALIYISYFRREFMLALTMGATRTEFLISFSMRQLLLMAFSYLMLLLLCFVESATYPLIFPGIISEFDIMPYLLNPILVICVAVVALVLTLFLGMLFCRYGKKVLVVIYIVYMLLCFGLSRLLHAQWLIALVVAIPLVGWIGIAVAAVAAMLASTVIMAKKQMVN